MSFVTALTVFVLAIYVGVEVINRVPPTLHTPLMSGSNAISGITVVGALILAGQPDVPELVHILAGVAVAFAMINVV
ncbi:MAG: H+-translocating transhydrogenase subunit alpha, partial [Acidobacteriota bacterium]|nr:H+-translocating transhydrogenase subunit alpha [Acidobacteriota bacterium]